MRAYHLQSKSIEVRYATLSGYIATLDSYDGAIDADDENGFVVFDSSEISAVNGLLSLLDLNQIDTLE